MKTNSKGISINIIGILVILLSALYMQIIHGGFIQTSVDSTNETHFLSIWAIYIVPIILIVLVPLNKRFVPLVHKRYNSTNILITLSIIFIVLMIITPKTLIFDLFYIYKLVLLLIIPLIIIVREKLSLMTLAKKQRQWLFPTIVVTLWIVIYFFSPLRTVQNINYDMSYEVVLIGAFISFLLNAVIEELFYRVWLQTRLEYLGILPSILISTILWSLWHIGIQGDGNIMDLSAHAITTHAIVGIFLGLFWAKYRNIWLLIVIHGLMNFPLYLITYWFN